MKNRKINGVKVYAPTSRAKLINFAFENNIILVAVNAEKSFMLLMNHVTSSIAM